LVCRLDINMYLAKDVMDKEDHARCQSRKKCFFLDWHKHPTRAEPSIIVFWAPLQAACICSTGLAGLPFTAARTVEAASTTNPKVQEQQTLQSSSRSTSCSSGGCFRMASSDSVSLFIKQVPGPDYLSMWPLSVFQFTQKSFSATTRESSKRMIIISMHRQFCLRILSNWSECVWGDTPAPSHFQERFSK